MYEGDEPKMGSTVVRGEVEATVAYTGKDSFLGKTAAMLQGPPEVSNLQKLLMKIMGFLVAISLTLCLVVFIYLLEKGEPVETALSFTVVLLVASIPVAIEIVCTTTLALGSHQLSEQGAIVSRLAAIEDLSGKSFSMKIMRSAFRQLLLRAGMTILCSDKTGTLTLNKMMIQEETPTYLAGETQYSLLRYYELVETVIELLLLKAPLRVQGTRRWRRSGRSQPVTLLTRSSLTLLTCPPSTT
jgi:H+-transporting ATPase